MVYEEWKELIVKGQRGVRGGSRIGIQMKKENIKLEKKIRRSEKKGDRTRCRTGSEK